MDGKVLFLCDDKKYSIVPKDKNTHIYSSLSEANAIEDYCVYITDGIDNQIHYNSNIIGEVKRGAVIAFLFSSKTISVSTSPYLDVFPFGLLNFRKFGRTDSIDIITTKKKIKEYLKITKKPSYVFNQIVKDTDEISKTCGIWLHNEKNHDIFDFEPFMIHKRSKDVFFGSISFGKGKIILLPQLDFYGDEELKLLVDIAKSYLDIESILSIKQPEWVDNIVSSSEKLLNDEIKEIDDKKKELIKQNRDYKRLKRLLYLNGKKLEKEVQFAFSCLNCKLEPTEPGANVDLYIDYKKMKFFAEITGTVSKIDKGSKKLTQLFNEVQNNKLYVKPMIIANTYMDKPLHERISHNFTKDAINVISPSKPCLMTTVDLYNLVIDFLEKKITAEKIMNLIYNTDGVFNYPTR